MYTTELTLGENMGIGSVAVLHCDGENIIGIGVLDFFW